MQRQHEGLTLPPSVFPQHSHSHYSSTEPGGNSSLNGDTLAKKDSIILKAVNTISTDRSSPSPYPAHTNGSPTQVTGYTFSSVEPFISTASLKKNNGNGNNFLASFRLMLPYRAWSNSVIPILHLYLSSCTKTRMH